MPTGRAERASGREGPLRRVLPAAALLALGWLLLTPGELHAWGPGTHVALGEAVLGALHLLPPAIRALLERHPIPFLYGSVAADISFAKKYAPEGRHCHNWDVGEEIHGEAGTDALRAAGLGYLAHLAADTVAHNFFIPRRLLLTSSTRAVGHTYWEHRMDVHLGEEYLGKARRLVVEHDHEDADQLFDEVLSRTIFSFETNRRIFRGMIRFQDNERWRQVFDRVLASSRWDLSDDRIDGYVALTFDYVVDYLVSRRESRPARLDPVGEVNLRLAKQVRHRALAEGGAEDPDVVDAMAEEFFPLPQESLPHWERIEATTLRPEDGPADDAVSEGEGDPEPGEPAGGGKA